MRPKSDADGVLQDVHWSGGSFGYFATYTLGNIVAAMIWHKMKDGEFVRSSLEKGDVEALEKWLRTNVHRYGATYAPKVLQQKVFGEAYNQDRLIEYFNVKYLS
jgi:carboxypeptidase Taq